MQGIDFLKQRTMEAVMASQDTELLDFVWKLLLDGQNDGTPPEPAKVINLFPSSVAVCYEEESEGPDWMRAMQEVA